MAPTELEPMQYQALAALTTEPQGHTGTMMLPNFLLSETERLRQGGGEGTTCARAKARARAYCEHCRVYRAISE